MLFESSFRKMEVAMLIALGQAVWIMVGVLAGIGFFAFEVAK